MVIGQKTLIKIAFRPHPKRNPKTRFKKKKNQKKNHFNSLSLSNLNYDFRICLSPKLKTRTCRAHWLSMGQGTLQEGPRNPLFFIASLNQPKSATSVGGQKTNCVILSLFCESDISVFSQGFCPYSILAHTPKIFTLNNSLPFLFFYFSFLFLLDKLNIVYEVLFQVGSFYYISLF